MRSCQRIYIIAWAPKQQSWRIPIKIKFPKKSQNSKQYSTFAAGLLDMTLEGMWEMFEGYSADMCAGKIPLVLIWSRAEGPACADTGARTLAEFFRKFSDIF